MRGAFCRMDGWTVEYFMVRQLYPIISHVVTWCKYHIRAFVVIRFQRDVGAANKHDVGAANKHDVYWGHRRIDF